MDALKSIFSNEHSLFVLLLILGATVLTALGVMPIAQWTSYSQWIFGIYMGGHAAISVGGAIAGRSTAQKAPSNSQAGFSARSLMLALTVVGLLMLAACAWWKGTSATSQGAHAGASCAVSDLKQYTGDAIAALEKDGYDQALKGMATKEHITQDVINCVITSIVTTLSAQGSGASLFQHSTAEPSIVLVHGRAWLDAHAGAQ